MSAPTPPPNPRYVTPGIETQTGENDRPEPGLYARLDWLRFTGIERRLEELMGIADRWFGNDRSPSNGAKFFRKGFTWEPGVQLSYGHKAGVVMIDVRGERLSMMRGDEQIELLGELGTGLFQPTRIDCALDWIDQDAHLYDHALKACKDGCLCRLRRWSMDPEYTSDGRILRKLLKLGKRSSSVCVRIYDKGLQRGWTIPGLWERMEVEFKDDRSSSALVALYEGRSTWCDVLASLVVGAVDFREPSNRSEIERRTRCEWWASLVEDLKPKQLQPEPSTQSLQKWVEGFQNSYGRRLVQMADLTDVEVAAVVDWMLNGIQASTSHSPVLREFVDQFDNKIFENSRNEDFKP